MNVFGEEYDLTNCTHEQIKEVEQWAKDQEGKTVPTDPDSTDGKYTSEDRRAKIFNDSDPLNLEMALESLKGNTKFKVELVGPERRVELYKMVHPLGGNMSVADASKQLGINKVTAYRWLTSLFELNPKTYDLHKWPTKAQLDVYRLIHPDLGGLTYHEAAKALKSTYQHVVQMMFRMRTTHPEAFAFERVRKAKVVRFNPVVHDEQVKEKF